MHSPIHEKKLPNQFILSLYSAITSQQYCDLIDWETENEKSFTIHKPHLFAEVVVPSICKHANLYSFVRQLNMYGFKKLKRKNQTQAISYFHPYFCKGKPDLIKCIARKNPREMKIQKNTQFISVQSNSLLVDEYNSTEDDSGALQVKENNTLQKTVAFNPLNQMNDIIELVCSAQDPKIVSLIRDYLNEDEEDDNEGDAQEYHIPKKIKLQEDSQKKEEVKDYVAMDIQTLEPMLLRTSQSKGTLSSALSQSYVFNRKDFDKCQTLISNLSELTNKFPHESISQSLFQTPTANPNEDHISMSNFSPNDFFSGLDFLKTDN